jgi:hypothetical protein
MLKINLSAIKERDALLWLLRTVVLNSVKKSFGTYNGDNIEALIANLKDVAALVADEATADNRKHFKSLSVEQQKIITGFEEIFGTGFYFGPKEGFSLAIDGVIKHLKGVKLQYNPKCGCGSF